MVHERYIVQLRPAHQAVKLRALLEINNLLSQDYDVILNYPMPKRNFRVTLTAEI